MTDESGSEQSSCCAGGDCCQPAGSKGKNRWKTLVFTAVILLAGAVTAYSVFWRDRGGANSPCCPTSAAGCATPCGTATAIAGLDDKLADAVYALVVFLPAGCVFSENAGKEIHAAKTELEAKGAQVRMLYFTAADSVFAKAAERYKITSCPTLLVHTNRGQTILAAEDISISSILDFFMRNQTTDVAGASTATGQSR